MAKYARTKSCGDGLGSRYETKMTALIALKLYQHSEEFNLANNYEKAGKFDDIVFSAKVDGSDVAWFVQLKHKQNKHQKIGVSNLRQKDDFNLLKYFASYRDIVKKFDEVSKDEIFKTPLKSTKFAVYTNATLNEALVKDFTIKTERLPAFLSTNISEEENVMFNVCDLQDILKIHTAADLDAYSLESFSQNFYLCTRQASECDLDSLIENEIKRIKFELNSMEVSYVARNFCEEIFSWIRSGNYVTKGTIEKMLSRTSRETGSNKNEFSLKFNDNFIPHVQNSYKDYNLVALKSFIDNTDFCMAFCKQAGFTDEPNKLVSLQKLDKKETQELINEWALKSTQPITLVIDCEGDTHIVNKNNIVEFLGTLTNVQVIMVVTTSNENALRIARDARAKEIKFNCTLANLTDFSKDSIFRAAYVNFQGYQTQLNSLMSYKKYLDTVFDIELMTSLLKGQSADVGVKPLANISYYVNRKLMRQSTALKELFTNLCGAAHFALSGITTEEYKASFPSLSDMSDSSASVLNDRSKLCEKKIIILENTSITQIKEEFSKLSKIVKGDLHYFQLKKGAGLLWQWKMSKNGSKMSPIKEYLNETNLESIATDTESDIQSIMDLPDKVLLITGEPGIGKSTLLGHLAAEIKRLEPSFWVISVTLNNYAEHFDQVHFIKNIQENTKKIIAAAAGLTKTTSNFAVRLFNQCYDVTGKMIVLLDGFDEITPNYIKQGLKFIDELRNSKISRVVVSARPLLRDSLENNASTLAYNIKHFTSKDQQNCLFKYWQNKQPLMSDNKLDDFVTEVLKCIDNILDSNFRQFTGIPLQTIMVAEIFSDSFESYHNTGDLSLNKRLNGLKLFQEFVNMKHKIEMEKADLKATNASAKLLQNELIATKEKQLMELALLALRVGHKVNPAVSDAKYLKEIVQKGNEKSGLILSFDGDIPHFIHRTFAEYFTALFFSKHFAENKQFLESNQFFSDDFSIVKYFFDRILCDGDFQLHEAVLRKDENLSLEDVNLKDSGGRTSLHLAAALPESEQVIKRLLENGAAVSDKDNVLGWSPLQYACKMKIVENIAPLLEAAPENEKIAKGLVPATWQNLRKAMQGDYLQLFLYLLDNDICKVEKLGELSSQAWLMDEENMEGLTILHLAAAYDSCKILKHLLDNKARDSKLELLEKEDKSGNTPLLLAAARGSKNAIRLFVKSGAITLKMSHDKKNLIQYAVEMQDLDILTIALNDAKNRNAPVDEFLPSAASRLVAEKGDRLDWAMDALILLCKLYPVNSLKSSKDLPLLFAAVQKNNSRAVQILCEAGADVNASSSQDTVINYAIRRKCDDIIQILERYRAVEPQNKAACIGNDRSQPSPTDAVDKGKKKNKKKSTSDIKSPGSDRPEAENHSNHQNHSNSLQETRSSRHPCKTAPDIIPIDRLRKNLEELGLTSDLADKFIERLATPSALNEAQQPTKKKKKKNKKKSETKTTAPEI